MDKTIDEILFVGNEPLCSRGCYKIIRDKLKKQAIKQINKWEEEITKIRIKFKDKSELDKKYDRNRYEKYVYEIEAKIKTLTDWHNIKKEEIE